MHKAFFRTIMLLLIAALLSAFVSPGTASAEIRFGVVPRMSAAELTAMFTPLADYLSRETGEKVVVVVPKDFDAFKAAVKAGHIDIGLTNPLIYVQVRKSSHVEPLALSAEPKAGTKIRGIFVARIDSGINKIQDLKGKKLVFVEKDSAAGYIFQMLSMTKAGINIDKDFTRLPFAKRHDAVVQAVVNKSADAGGIREDDLDKMKDKFDLSQIKIIAYTDYFPNWPMFASQGLDKGVAAKVKAALLNLKAGGPETDKVLGPCMLTGFTAVSDKDYDMLRMAASLVGAF